MQTIRSKAEVLTRGVGGPGEDGYTAVQLAKPPLACILASPSLHQVLPGLEVVQTQPCTLPPPPWFTPHEQRGLEVVRSHGSRCLWGQGSTPEALVHPL